MTREERYNQLLRVAGSKDGMLQLQSLRQRLCGQTPVRNDDSLERLIKEIFDAESPPNHFTAHHHGTDKLGNVKVGISIPSQVYHDEETSKENCTQDDQAQMARDY